MNAPFYEYGLFGDGTGLVVAFVVGIGFGFFLERAGFGSARKLASQFYLTDLTVFKVMFSAVVTALLGLYWLSWAGILDLSRVSLLPSYPVPQAVGGLIFGIGFVSGGYCPGTACVAASTGKLDGFVHITGMITGILMFAEMFPLLKGFYESSAMGEVTLGQALGVPENVMVFLIVALAVLGFIAAEKIEARKAARAG
jgi:uncharacterized membrane protein YedE/YeeE